MSDNQCRNCKWWNQNIYLVSKGDCENMESDMSARGFVECWETCEHFEEKEFE